MGKKGVLAIPNGFDFPRFVPSSKERREGGAGVVSTRSSWQLAPGENSAGEERSIDQRFIGAGGHFLLHPGLGIEG